MWWEFVLHKSIYMYGASVHGMVVGDFAHISINASLAGGVIVGKNTFVGMGANVINKVKIASNNIIGAGSVVIKNTKINQTLAGIPAKEL